jgi:hypothetical protein
LSKNSPLFVILTHLIFYVFSSVEKRREGSEDVVEGEEGKESHSNTVTPIKSWLRKHIMEGETGGSSMAAFHKKPVYIIPQVRTKCPFCKKNLCVNFYMQFFDMACSVWYFFQ